MILLEEFVVLLPATDADASRLVAERLRASVSLHPWPGRAVTASFGVATSDSGLCKPSRVLDRADQTLYHAKRTGRDRVVHERDFAPNPSASGGPIPGVTPATADLTPHPS